MSKGTDGGAIINMFFLGPFKDVGIEKSSTEYVKLFHTHLCLSDSCLVHFGLLIRNLTGLKKKRIVKALIKIDKEKCLFSIASGQKAKAFGIAQLTCKIFWTPPPSPFVWRFHIYADQGTYKGG